MDNKEWRKLFKNCEYKYYDTQNVYRFLTGQVRTKGNPMCAHYPIGVRCTFAGCPDIEQMEIGELDYSENKK